MSIKLIPEHIDPYRFAEQGLGLSGIAKLETMERLKSSLKDAAGDVNVELQFGIDEQGTTYLKGHLKTTLDLQCQRCMGPLTYEIMSDFTLGIVNSLEEANNLTEHYEPALAKDRILGLRELIEDEIILNLPIIPRHTPDVCKVKLPLTDSEWEKEKSSPFHVLESLKHKQR